MYANLVPVLGDPAVVSQRSAEYLETSTLILAAADDLASVSSRSEMVSLAVNEIRSLASQVHDDITAAQARYHATAQALADFAPVLAEAQERANTAIDAYYPAVNASDELYNDVLYGPGDESESAETRDEWLLADARTQGIVDDYNSAVSDITNASNAAAELISAVIDGSDLNDSFWDNVTGVAGAIGDWFAQVFGPLVDGILEVISRIDQIFAYLITIAALILVLSLMPTVLLVLGGIWLFGGEDAARDAAIALAVVLITPLVNSAIRNGKDEPTVTPTGSPRTQEIAPGTDGETSYYERMIKEQSTIDAAGADGFGGADSAVVQVSQVVGPDGVTRWRVQIPSTQQWLSFGGDAPNDLDGNLSAKLNPAERSALEKSVEQALLQAGYIPGSGNPVMLSGFSQGGIAAGNLAADPDFTEKFNVEAIFTVGSPIGDIPIPSNVDVLAIEHDSDPVPHADFFTPNPTGPNWTTISTPTPSDDPVGHNSTDYGTSASTKIDKSTDPDIIEIRNSQQNFFVGTETQTRYESRR